MREFFLPTVVIALGLMVGLALTTEPSRNVALRCGYQTLRI
jgi:hypothetical protein